jgi:uncharacterized membrane protein YgcG
MFSAGTVSSLDSQIASLNASTGKEIVVVTVPSLNGETVANAAQKVFSEQNVNGVLIFIAKDDRQDIIIPGNDTAQFFPIATNQSIRTSMESQFKNGDFDGGITTAVGGVLDVFRAHQNTGGAPQSNSYAYPAAATTSRHIVRSGVHFSMFMWIIFLVIGWLVIRSIFRATCGPRYYGGGGPGMAGPGYGGPGYGGYGPGYYGGGGGGFWSGLLGGLGGAWLGNEMFGNRGTTIIDDNSGGNIVNADQGGSWGGNSGGWGNDSGQADMGASSSGDFSGGGFGDFGGGGGGDFGGGGGDSGGGW